MSFQQRKENPGFKSDQLNIVLMWLRNIWAILERQRFVYAIKLRLFIHTHFGIDSLLPPR